MAQLLNTNITGNLTVSSLNAGGNVVADTNGVLSIGESGEGDVTIIDRTASLTATNDSPDFIENSGKLYCKSSSTEVTSGSVWEVVSTTTPSSNGMYNLIAGYYTYNNTQYNTLLIGYDSNSNPAANSIALTGSSTVVLSVGDTFSVTINYNYPYDNYSWATSGYFRGPFTYTEVVKNPITAAGDLIVGGTGGVVTKLAASSSGQVLMSNGANLPLSWSPAPWMSNPMTTLKDLIVGGASGAPTRLAAGSTGNFLKVGSSGLEWASISSAGTTLYKHTLSLPNWKGPGYGNITLEIISNTMTPFSYDSVMHGIDISSTTRKIIYAARYYNTMTMYWYFCTFPMLNSEDGFIKTIQYITQNNTIEQMDISDFTGTISDSVSQL